MIKQQKIKLSDWQKVLQTSPWPTRISHLCKVKIVRVCLLPSQPHRDEDDDSSAVRRSGGRHWLVALWRGRGICSLRRDLPCSRCPVAIHDIGAVDCGGSITQRSFVGFCVCCVCLSICLFIRLSVVSVVWDLSHNCLQNCRTLVRVCYGYHKCHFILRYFTVWLLKLRDLGALVTQITSVFKFYFGQICFFLLFDLCVCQSVKYFNKLL